MTPPLSPGSTRRNLAVPSSAPTSLEVLGSSPAISPRPIKSSPLKNTLALPPESWIGKNVLPEAEGSISQQNSSLLQENDSIGVEIASRRETSAPPPDKNNLPQNDRALPHNQNTHSGVNNSCPQGENQSPQDIILSPNRSGQTQEGMVSSQDQVNQIRKRNPLPVGEKHTAPKEITRQLQSKQKHALPQQPNIATSTIVPPRKQAEDSVLALARELGYTSRKELYDFFCTPTLLHPIIEYHHTKFKIIEKAPHMKPKLQKPLDFEPRAIEVMAAQDPKYIYDRYDIEKITTHKDNQLRFMCRLIFEVRLLNGCGENSHLAEPEICRLISEIMRVTEREFWEVHLRHRGSELVNVLRKSAQDQGIEVLAKAEGLQKCKRKASYTLGEGNPQVKKAMVVAKGAHVNNQSQRVASSRVSSQKRSSPVMSAPQPQEGEKPDVELEASRTSSRTMYGDTVAIKKIDAINTTSNAAIKSNIAPAGVIEAEINEMMATAGAKIPNEANVRRHLLELKTKEVQRRSTDVMMHGTLRDHNSENGTGYYTNTEKTSLIVKFKIPKERANSKGLTDAVVIAGNTVHNEDMKERKGIDINSSDKPNFKKRSLIVKLKIPEQGIYNNTVNGVILNENDTGQDEAMSTRPEIELKIVKDLIDYDMVEDSDNETFFEASEKTSFVPASKPPTSQSPEEHMEYIPLKLQEGQASTGIDTTMVDADESTAEWGQDGVEEYGFSAKDNQMSDVFSSRASDIEAADSTNAELFNMSISEGLQTHDPAVALMFPEDNSFHESAFNRGSVGEEEDTADIIRLGELVGLGDSHMSDH